jgi:peroxiredoxin Q/BCP
MEAYRDQYATLFNNGRNVVVIGISVDPDTTLASWAHTSDFPMLFASDTGGHVGRQYGSWDPKNKLDTRNAFVIAPDGRIAHVMLSFKALSPDAYTELASAVDRVAGATESGDGS